MSASSYRQPVTSSATTGDWKLGTGNWKLSCFLNQRDRLFLGLHHLAGDHAFADLLLAREVVHQVEHEVLDDHPQAARANFARECRFGDRLEGIVGEAELHVLVLEQLLVLTRD